MVLNSPIIKYKDRYMINIIDTDKIGYTLMLERNLHVIHVSSSGRLNVDLRYLHVNVVIGQPYHYSCIHILKFI